MNNTVIDNLLSEQAIAEEQLLKLAEEYEGRDHFVHDFQDRNDIGYFLTDTGKIHPFFTIEEMLRFDSVGKYKNVNLKYLPEMIFRRQLWKAFERTDKYNLLEAFEIIDKDLVYKQICNNDLFMFDEAQLKYEYR